MRVNKGGVCGVGLGVCLTLASAQVAAQQASGQGEVFKFAGHGLRLEIQALARDQVQGFAIGRGFSAKDAAFAADRGCVFRSNIGNAAGRAGAPVLELDLGQWRVRTGGQTQALLDRAQWDGIWRQRKVAEAARIAFRWALFPSRQRHAPGDYNWGFLSMGLKPGTRFDLDIAWRYDGKAFSHSFKGLVCGT